MNLFYIKESTILTLSINSLEEIVIDGLSIGYRDGYKGNIVTRTMKSNFNE